MYSCIHTYYIYIYTYIYIYIYREREIYTHSYIDGASLELLSQTTFAAREHLGMETVCLRGWRNTVGNLIELLGLNKTTYHGPQSTGICVTKTEGYGFVEFEISNTTIPTDSANLSLLPLVMPASLDSRGRPPWCQTSPVWIWALRVFFETEHNIKQTTQANTIVSFATDSRAARRPRRPLGCWVRSDASAGKGGPPQGAVSETGTKQRRTAGWRAVSAAGLRGKGPRTPCGGEVLHKAV